MQAQIVHTSYLSVIYLELDYQVEKAKFSSYNEMRTEYECALRETLNDQTLQVVIMEPGSLKLSLSTIQLLSVLNELSQRRLELPAPKTNKFNRVQVNMPWPSGEIKFVEADQLCHFVTTLLEDSKRQHVIQTNIAAHVISTSQRSIDPIQVTEDVLRPICEKVISYSKTTRPCTIHFTQLEDELVGEVRWDKTVNHKDWLHIIVNLNSICIVYDKPGKDEYIEFNDPDLQRRVVAAISTLSQ